eukprot:g8294.t1
MNDNSVPKQEAPKSATPDIHGSTDGTLVREGWMTMPREGWLSAPKNQQEARRAPTDHSDPSVAKHEALDLSKTTTVTGVTTVGDGGASWRLRALERMQQRSKTEGTNLNQLAQERGYNLDELIHESKREGRAVKKSSERRKHRSYLNDVQSDRSKMRKPKLENSSLTKKKKKKQEPNRSPKSFNQFPSDGSFFENFLKKSESTPNQEQVLPQQGDNHSIADQLRQQLKQHGSSQTPTSTPIVLPMMDSDGRPSRGAFGRESSKKRRENDDDDDDDDIATLYKRSKYRDDAIDIDNALANKIVRNKRFEPIDVDAEYDFDVGSNLHKKRNRKNAKSKLNREKRDAIRDYRKMETIGERCPLCFGSKTFPKNLVVSIGTMTYLRLPIRGALDPFHCHIIPIEHLPSTRQVDEDVWTEIRNFKKCLIMMNREMEKEVIFMETAIHLDDHTRHALIECIPVDQEVFQKAPMYFKKAIDDATGDWSQHHSKRCIDTGTKGLRGSIPENFPYFHVEFGISNGFVHVVDDEAEFDIEMGRRVLISLLGRPVEEIYQSGSQKDSDQQQKTIDTFVQKWNAFDWTSKL